MRLRRKTELPGATIELGRRKQGLQMLALIFAHTGVVETTNERVSAKGVGQKRGSASVHAANEEEPTATHSLWGIHSTFGEYTLSGKEATFTLSRPSAASHSLDQAPRQYFLRQSLNLPFHPGEGVEGSSRRRMPHLLSSMPHFNKNASQGFLNHSVFYDE